MPVPSLRVPTAQEYEAIAQIRSAFEAEFKCNPDLYHKSDVDRVLENDWTVHRFLLAGDGTASAGLTRLINAMKWRKEWAIHEMSETDFPKQFYQMMRFGRARNGSTVVLTRAQFYIPLNEWRELFKKFFVFVLETLDRQNTGAGITVVLDLRDCRLFNVDFDFVWFVKPIQSKYYPFLLRQQLNCDIPWILSSVSQFILSLMPQKTRKLMHFIKLCELSDHVMEEYIPVYMGGTGVRNYSWIPDTCTGAEELAKSLDLTEKNLKKLMSHLVPLVETYSH